MKKRVLSLVLAITLILGMSIPGLADSPPISVSLNGKEMVLENEAYLNDEGRVMVPIRQIVESMDYEVEWNGEDRRVTMSKDSDLVQLKIGESKILSNSEEIDLIEKPIIKDSKTFVSLEFLSNAFELVIGWDSKYQSLNITQPIDNKEDYFKISEESVIKENLNTYMNALEKNKSFYGSVLVAKDGNVLLYEGYGYADVNQLTLNKPQTKFAIGSITKQFVAMAIMQLSEDGLMNVDDKLSNYFPEFPNGDIITVHHLLTHSSGLVNYTEISEAFLNPEINSPSDILNLITDKELLFSPGESFSYSNTNYLMLGMIVEKVSGLSYDEYLKLNILEPLNMAHTGFAYEEDYSLHDASAYTGHIEVVPVDDEMLLSIAYGAGSMYSTVGDLYRWDQALNTEILVKDGTKKEIFSNHIDIVGAGHYGYGWMIDDLGFDKMIYHGGNTLGFTSDITRLEDSHISMIILSNKGYVDLSNMKNNLISIALGGEYVLPEAKEIIEIEDTTIYNEYTGQYRLLPELGMDTLDIIKLEDRLYAQVTGQGAFEIYPISETKFIAKIADVEIEFKVDEEGSVSELIFSQGPLVINSTKVDKIKEKVEVDLDPTIIEDYVGEYEIMPGFVLTIFTEEDQIFAQLTGQGPAEIFPSSESEFFYKIVDATITFIKDEEGNVSGMTLKQMGQELAGTKIN